jgi:hypothetical protein
MATITPDEAIQAVEDHEGGVVRIPISEVREIDIGEYCVDCRRPVDERTEWFASRQPHVQESEDKSERIIGYLCDDCQPIEGTLMEPIIDALVGRRYDERQIRTHMKRVGAEELYAELVEPMLDMMETLLQLERK